MREGYCKESVWGDYHSYQCQRKAKRDGYCTQHHPDSAKAREYKRAAKWRLERKRRELAATVELARSHVVHEAMALFRLGGLGENFHALNRACAALAAAQNEQDPVAQRIERRASNSDVGGSNPPGITNQPSPENQSGSQAGSAATGTGSASTNDNEDREVKQ